MEEASELSVEPAVKKKRYSIKVDAESVQESGGKDIKQEEIVESEATAREALDPAEFARQERLRKQREKQVKAIMFLYLFAWIYYDRQSFNQKQVKENSLSLIQCRTKV